MTNLDLSPPSWGLRAGRLCRLVLQFYLPTLVWPLVAPPPPPTGRGLRASGPAGSGSTALHQLPALQNTSGIRSSSPSWADVVRNGSRLDTSPPAATASASALTTADFLALYDRCISSCLKTRINMSNSAGVQEIILTCQILTSFAPALRRRRRRRHGQAVSAAVPSRTSHPPILSAPPSTWPEPPLPLPPAKRMKKALRGTAMSSF